MQLETLLLEFAADTRSLDSAIDQAVRKARTAAAQIDQVLGKSYGKGANLNLTPKVDHRNLEALNKHLDIKKKHFDEVQRHLNGNPLRVEVDDSQVIQATDNVRKLRQELGRVSTTATTGSRVSTTATTGSVNQSGANTASSTSLIAAVKDLPKEIAKELKNELKSGIGEKLGGAISAPIKAVGALGGNILQGLIFGATNQLGSDFGKGISEAVEDATGGAIGSTKLLGRRMGEALAKAIGDVIPERLRAEITKGLREDLGEEEVLVASRANAARQQKNQSTQKQKARKQLDVDLREAIRQHYDFLDTRRESQSQMQQAASARSSREQSLSAVQQRQYEFQLTQQVPEAFTTEVAPELTGKPLEEIRTRYSEYLDKVATELSGQIADLATIEEKATTTFYRVQEELRKKAEQIKGIMGQRKTLKPEEIPQAYMKLVRDMAGGEELPREKIPQLRIADESLKKANAQAQYSAVANVIDVSEELFNAVKQGNLTVEQMQLLYHELQHAVQFGYGSHKGIEARDEWRSLKPLATPTVEELREVGPLIGQYAPEKRPLETDAEITAMRKAKEARARAEYEQAIAGATSSFGVGGERLENIAATQINKALTDLRSLQALSGKTGVSLSQEIEELSSGIYNMSEKIRQSLEVLSVMQIKPQKAENVQQLQEVIGRQFAELEGLLQTVEDFKKEALSKIKQGVSETNPPDSDRPPLPPLTVPIKELEVVSAERLKVSEKATSNHSSLTTNHFLTPQVDERLALLSTEVQAGSSKASQDAATAILESFRATRQEINRFLEEGNKEQARVYAQVFADNAKRAYDELTRILEQAKQQGVEVQFGDELSSIIGRAKGMLTNMLKPVNRILAEKEAEVESIKETTKSAGEMNSRAFPTVPDPWLDESKDARLELDKTRSTLEDVEQLAQKILHGDIPGVEATTLHASRQQLIGHIEGLLNQSSSESDVGGEFKEARLNVPGFLGGQSLDEQQRQRLQELLELLKHAEEASSKFNSAFNAALNHEQLGTNNRIIAEQVQRVEAYNRSLDNMLHSEQKAVEPVGRLGGAFGKLGNVIESVATSALAFAGVFTFGDIIVRAGQASLEAALEMERLKVALDFSTAGKGAETLERLRKQSDDLGISFKETAEGYQQLSAAALGTSLENQVGRISKELSEGISVRALTPEQSKSVYTAISQIFGKGTVQAQELVLQLGQAMSGSLQVAARAISGGSVPELLKRSESGNLLAQEFIPKFTAQLSAESVSGIGAASDTATAKLNRLNNKIDALKENVGGLSLSSVKPAIDAATGGLDFLNKNFQAAAKVAEVLAVYFGTNLVLSLGRLAAALGLTKLAMKALGLAGLELRGMGLQGVVMNLTTLASGLIKSFLVPAAITTGLDFLFHSLDRRSAGLKDINASLETSIRSIEEAYNKAGNAAAGFVEKAKPKVSQEGPQAEDPLLRFADRFVVNPVNKVFDFLNQTPQETFGGTRPQNAPGRVHFRTSGEAAQDDNIVTITDTLMGVNSALNKTGSRLNDPKLVNQTIQQLKSLNLQIQQIQSRQNVLRLEGSTEEVKTLQQALDKLQGDRRSIMKKVFGSRGDLDNFKQQLEGMRNEINRMISAGSMTPEAAAPSLNYINVLLKETERQMGAVENATKQTAAAFENMRLKVGNVNAAFENTQYRNEQMLNAAKTNILQRQAAGNLGESAANQATIRAEQESYQQRLAQLQEFIRQYQALINQLTQGERSSLENYLGKSINSAGPGDITRVKDLYKDNLTGNQESILDARQRILELQKDAQGAAQGIAQGAVNLRTALRQAQDSARQLKEQVANLIKEYSNFLRGIVTQTKETALEVQSLTSQIRTNSMKSALLQAMTTSTQGIYKSFTDLIIGYFDEAQQLTQRILDQQRARIESQNQDYDLRQQNQGFGKQATDLNREVSRFNESNQGGSRVGEVKGVGTQGSSSADSQRGNINTSRGSREINQLSAGRNQVNDLNQQIINQEIDAYRQRVRAGVTDMIRQSNDAFRDQRRAIRDLAEQQSDLVRQYQRESVANTLVQQVESVRRSFRGSREGYEKQSIDLQNNITGAQNTIKSYPAKIEQLRSSDDPLDPIKAEVMERTLANAQTMLPKYQEQLKSLRQNYAGLGGEEQTAIASTVNETLRKVAEETKDSLKSIQRSMRDAGKEYDDLTSQFQKPTFELELQKAIDGVDKQFQGFRDNLSDRKGELVKQLDDLQNQVNAAIEKLFQPNVQADPALANPIKVALGEKQQQLEAVQGAIAFYEDQIRKLTGARQQARDYTTTEFTKKKDQERDQFLVDTQSSWLEAGKGSHQLSSADVAELQARIDRLKEDSRFKNEMKDFDDQVASFKLDPLQAAIVRAQKVATNKMNIQNINDTEDTAMRQGRQEEDQYLVDTQANLLTGRASRTDEFEAAKLNAQAARIKENLRFSIELENFPETAKKMNLVGENAEIVKKQLQQINQVNLKNINDSVDLLTNKLKQGIGSAIENLVVDFSSGSKTMSAAFTDFGRSVLGTISQIFAQQAAARLTKTLFSMFADGGTVENYATGGMIGNYATGGLATPTAIGLGIMDAMRREGPQAVPIVASIGEEVLSTRNSDAQFYRALKANGIWNEMKQQHVVNFAAGGMVGANPKVEATPRYRAGQRVSTGDTNVTVNMSITTPDANSFRRSEGQIASDSALAARRAYERNK